MGDKKDKEDNEDNEDNDDDNTYALKEMTPEQQRDEAHSPLLYNRDRKGERRKKKKKKKSKRARGSKHGENNKDVQLGYIGTKDHRPASAPTSVEVMRNSHTSSSVGALPWWGARALMNKEPPNEQSQHIENKNENKKSTNENKNNNDDPEAQKNESKIQNNNILSCINPNATAMNPDIIRATNSDIARLRERAVRLTENILVLNDNYDEKNKNNDSIQLMSNVIDTRDEDQDKNNVDVEDVEEEGDFSL